MIPMIQGRCQATVRGRPGLTDEPFLRAKAAGRLLEFFNSLPVAQRSGKTENLAFDNFAGMFFYRTWSSYGAPQPETYWSEGAIAYNGSSILKSVMLMDTSTEPSLQEFSGTYWGHISDVHGDSVDTTYAGKRFVRDDADLHDLVIHPGGRESIVFTSRFLWLPSQNIDGVNGLQNIRSVGYFWGSTSNQGASGDSRHVMMGRVRLKDSGGTPITMDKTPNQALLIEYEFEFVSN
jgi:hypothetical protein